MMQHVRERNRIQAAVGDRPELVEVMAIKDVIEIIQIEHVARSHIWVETGQRRYAAPNLQNSQLSHVAQVTKLVSVKLSIPKQQIFVRCQTGAVSKSGLEILRILIRNNCVALHAKSLHGQSRVCGIRVPN